MVTVTPYTDPENCAYPGEGFDGVVRVSVAGYYGTGVLLYDGRAILTAAHLISHVDSYATVNFETSAGNWSANTSRVIINPAYDPINNNNDLALVWLSSGAPLGAERYTLYRDSDEIGQPFTMVGYGTPGTGASGSFTSYDGRPTRLKAINEFDADVGTLKSYMGAGMAWTPLSGTQLIADFDDGTIDHDALGQLIRYSGIGLGVREGLIAPGDSGGPAFINDQIAGIASYNASLSLGSIHPDIDSINNSSFGEIAAWQRVEYYQQWIDQNLRANYPDAPTRSEDVLKEVVEGNSGTSYAYFMLEFTGVRGAPDQWLSVDYITRDGTALAGEDYLAANGRLVLYPGENQAVIPVEIVGDTKAEQSEYFYLDVFNPVGGSFGDGVVKLTAVRTILDNDGGLFG